MSESNSGGRGFRIYVSVMLTLAVILLAGILAAAVFAGLKVGSEANTLSTKVNDFNQKVDQINRNLDGINKQLQSPLKVVLP